MPFHFPFFASLKTLSLASIAIACTSAVQPAWAQQVESASNPSAAVPPVSYRSVFKETSLGVEKDSVDWRKANNDVGRFTRGHLDILKEEERELAAPMAKPMEGAAPMQKPAPGTMPEKSMDTVKPAAPPAHKH
jgi:hypothetical protein